MQSLNRKEMAIKTLLILISILSILLIIEGIDGIKHSLDIIENQGGFDIYPINHPDTIVQEWYYCIFRNVLFTLFPVMVLILSMISIFVKNRIIEIVIIAQTVLTLLLGATANYKIIGETISYYTYIVIAFSITLIPIIISVIKEKTVFVFYIIGIVLLIAKYVNVYKFWYSRVRGDMSLFSWFDMYGVKYAIITILGFCILILKRQKQNNKKIIKS